MLSPPLLSPLNPYRGLSHRRRNPLPSLFGACVLRVVSNKAHVNTPAPVLGWTSSNANTLPYIRRHRRLHRHTASPNKIAATIPIPVHTQAPTTITTSVAATATTILKVQSWCPRTNLPRSSHIMRFP